MHYPSPLSPVLRFGKHELDVLYAALLRVESLYRPLTDAAIGFNLIVGSPFSLRTQTVNRSSLPLLSNDRFRVCYDAKNETTKRLSTTAVG